MFSKNFISVFFAAFVLVAAGCATSQRETGSIELDVVTGNEVSAFQVSCAAESRQRLDLDAGSVINNKSLLEPILESDVAQLRRANSGDKLTKSGEEPVTVAAQQSGLDREILDQLFDRCFASQ